DLSSIRIHADRSSGELAERLQARAFTVGSDIFFAPGQFQPQTQSGMRVLGHELTHAAQQGAVSSVNALSAHASHPRVTGGAAGVQREVAPHRIEDSGTVLSKIWRLVNTHIELGKDKGSAIANMARIIGLGIGFNPGADPSEKSNSFVYMCNCGWID